MCLSVLLSTFFQHFQQGLETNKLLVLLIWKSAGKSFCSMPRRKRSQHYRTPKLFCSWAAWQVTVGQGCRGSPLGSVMNQGSRGLVASVSQLLASQRGVPWVLPLPPVPQRPPSTDRVWQLWSAHLSRRTHSHTQSQTLASDNPKCLSHYVECSSSSSLPCPLGLAWNLRKQTSIQTVSLRTFTKNNIPDSEALFCIAYFLFYGFFWLSTCSPITEDGHSRIWLLQNWFIFFCVE